MGKAFSNLLSLYRFRNCLHANNVTAKENGRQLMPPDRTGKKPVPRADALNFALRHHRREEFEEARRACLTAWRKGRPDARIPYLMACIEAHADNLESAAAWFRHAARRDAPARTRAHPARGALPQALSETLSQDPQPERICRNISIRLHRGGDDRAAILALKAWLAYAPGVVRAMEVLGEAAGRIGGGYLPGSHRDPSPACRGLVCRCHAVI
jgi:hypothetical protein